jgi:SAM-dependent methyltransferase
MPRARRAIRRSHAVLGNSQIVEGYFDASTSLALAPHRRATPPPEKCGGGLAGLGDALPQMVVRSALAVPAQRMNGNGSAQWAQGSSMSVNALHRKLTVNSLLPERCECLLDVGCGPVTPGYLYAERAEHVTCLDWKLRRVEPIPSNVECIEGDFTTIDLPQNFYDVIVAADVFEHVLLEAESAFIERCVSLLKPGGHMIVSVPHRGTFAWLDPYNIKPTIHRTLWRLGLYGRLHNGSCDIRKGHKHYSAEELAGKFSPLQLDRELYWGYFFDPLLSWAESLTRGKVTLPGDGWLQERCRREFERSWGRRAFNMALRFYKAE